MALRAKGKSMLIIFVQNDTHTNILLQILVFAISAQYSTKALYK